MITAADEIFADFKTSCTREVAVAKLLGWMQGPVRTKNVSRLMGEITEDQLVHLNFLEKSVKEVLLEMRDAAQQKLYMAYEDDDEQSTVESQRALELAADNVDRCTERIRLAAKYYCDIDDELASKDRSRLKVDIIATKAKNNPYITLNSLDAWALEKYKLSIFQNEEITSNIEGLREHIKQLEDTCVDIDEPIFNEKGGMSKTSTESFLVTFAVLIELFVQDKGPQYRSDGSTDVNVKMLATLLSEKSLTDARKGKFLRGQGVSIVKKRINAALDKDAPVRTRRRKAMVQKK